MKDVTYDNIKSHIFGKTTGLSTTYWPLPAPSPQAVLGSIQKTFDILYLQIYFYITNDIPWRMNKISIRITFTF